MLYNILSIFYLNSWSGRNEKGWLKHNLVGKKNLLREKYLAGNFHGHLLIGFRQYLPLP